MFLGTYRHQLDLKNRLTIPSKILFNLPSKTVVLSKGFDGCLELRTLEAFEQYSKKLMTLSQNKINSRTLLRQLLANASEIEIDSAKRILVPNNLIDEANLSKSVVILGLGNKCEIWDEAVYEKFKENSDNILEDLAESLEDESF
ncbi:MAG: division/cell wall cluster transcriptional repressor MraZ [Mycoplasma sp.]